MIKCSTRRQAAKEPLMPDPKQPTDTDISYMLREARSCFTSKKYAEATAIYHRLATLGVPEAEREYGKMLLEGRLLRKNPEGGAALLTSAAEAGDAEAIFRLSALTPGGAGRELSVLLSAALGYAGAFSFAAEIYMKRGDTHAAKEMLLLAREAGDAAAARRLCQICYDEGNTEHAAWAISGFDREFRKLNRKMQRILRKTAPKELKDNPKVKKAILVSLRHSARERGFRRGYFLLTERLCRFMEAEELVLLGRLYLWGEGCEKSADKARKLFETASSLGSADAACELGNLELSCGRDTLAAELYIKAAERGRADCFGKAGDLLIKTSPSRGLELYGRGEQAGDTHSLERRDLLIREREALFALATSKSESNRDEAEALFRRSATLGYSPALCALASLLAEKRSRRSRKEAFSLYLEARSVGEDEAYFGLGKCLAEGIGVRRNYKEAIHYLSISARIGNGRAAEALAAIDLGKKRRRARALYSAGIRHVHSKRFKEARDALSAASELGSSAAHYALGCLCEFGRGGVSNREIARSHYAAARVGGFRDPDGSYKRRILSMSR